MIKYLRFLRCLCVWLFITTPLELVGLLILAVVLPFLGRDATKLPKLLRWWDNYEAYALAEDDPDLDGLSGPDYYRERRGITILRYSNGNQIGAGWDSIDGTLISRKKLFVERYIWLAIRNPLNYFQYSVIGALMNTHHVHTKYDPPFAVLDEEGGKMEASTLDGKYWEYYYVIPYGRLWPGRALRLRWGWKISSGWRPIQQFVFVVQPFFTLG